MPGTETEHEQDCRRESDMWEDAIEIHLTSLFTKKITITQIATTVLNLEIERHDVRVSRRIGSILRLLGWVKKSFRDKGSVYRAWVPA